MRIAVFGASGRTGRLLVDTLIDRGQQVTAFVRDPARLERRHDALRLVTGTLDDKDAIADAVAGADCVVSTLASGHGLLTRLAETLVPVLVENGPRRIVTLAGAATELPGDPQVFKRRFFLMMMGLGGRHFTDDVRAHWAAVQKAGLDATLVRPPRLTDGPATGRIRHGTDIVLGMTDSISRADLAVFLADLVLDGRYVGEAPFVAAA